MYQPGDDDNLLWWKINSFRREPVAPSSTRYRIYTYTCTYIGTRIYIHIHT